MARSMTSCSERNSSGLISAGTPGRITLQPDSVHWTHAPGVLVWHGAPLSRAVPVLSLYSSLPARYHGPRRSRDSAGNFQQRLEPRPDRGQEPWLRGRVRVDAVLLHQGVVERDAVQEERHEREPVRTCEVGKQAGRTPACIAGRSWAACACRRAVRAHLPGSRRPTMRSKLARMSPTGRPRSPSLPPSSTNDDLRPMLRQGPRQARHATAGRLAARAGVDDPVTVPFLAASVFCSRATQPCSS